MGFQGSYSSAVKGFAYLTAAVLVVIAIGVGVNASTWQKPIQFSNKLTQFNNQYLRFEYPASWTAETYKEVSSFTDSLVFLSNRELHAPCVSLGNSGGYTCSYPLSRLGYDGVLVNGWPTALPGGPLRTSLGCPSW